MRKREGELVVENHEALGSPEEIGRNSTMDK